MNKPSFLGALSATLALAATLGTALADPLETVLAKGGGEACFERTYDAAHLQKNPNQDVRSMLLSLKTEADLDGTALRIKFTGKSRILYMQGDCAWAAKANLDVMGKPLIPAFKGPSGLDCHVFTTADMTSAEEGGDFPIDLRDGRSVTVHFPDELAAWRSTHREQPAKFERFGADDRAFRLNAASPSVCADLVRKLEPVM